MRTMLGVLMLVSVQACAMAADLEPQFIHQPSPMSELVGWLKVSGILLTFIGIAFSGWNLWLQGKLKTVDEHEEKLKRLDNAERAVIALEKESKTSIGEVERELRAVWKWKEDFERQYNNERISLVEKFATKMELSSMETRMSEEFKGVRESIDKLRDSIDKRFSRGTGD